MVNRNTIHYMLIAAGLIAVLVYWLVFSEENRVRHVIKAGAALVTKTANDQQLALAARSNRLKPLLADELLVDIPAYQFQGKYHKNDVATSILAAFSHVEFISVQVFDLAVTIASDSEAAAILTAEITRQLPGREKETDYLQLSCSLQQKAGDWVINRIEVIETLEK